MKAVMLSVQPKWCSLIASGKKTVEVRKTKPKLDVPFKCYIYCTKGDWLTSVNGKVQKPNNMVIDLSADSKIEELNGKVIGEFVCDSIYPFHYDLSNGFYEPREFLWGSCLSLEQLKDYVGGSLGYGWHISNLVIYDQPKELSEFYTVLSDNDIRCKHIQMRYTINGKRYNKCTLQNCVCEFRRLGHQTDCDGYEILNPQKPITRPPQSWCYVEER